MAFLPLGKSVLPVLLMESCKVCNTVDAKVCNNGIRILLGEVADAVEHLCHSLAVRGLWLVELARPRIVGIFIGKLSLASLYSESEESFSLSLSSSSSSSSPSCVGSPSLPLGGGTGS